MNPVDKPTARPRFSANRKLTLFTLLALPLLLTLGTWQLDRAADKRLVETAYIEQQSLPPGVLTGQDLSTLPDHRRVQLHGRFEGDHTWLLDNKQRRGRVGYEVVSAFRLNDNSVVLVNRGWLQGTPQREVLPDIPAVTGEQTLFGELMTASTHPLLDGTSEREGWPKVIMAIEPAAMAVHLGEPLSERYVRLDEGSSGALVTGWQPVNVSSAKHLGYALQWFGMAVALVIWFIVANTKLLHTWRRPRS